MKENLGLKSYLAFSIIYLLIVLFQQDETAWYLKPFLIPFLLITVYFFENFSTKKVFSVNGRTGTMLLSIYMEDCL